MENQPIRKNSLLTVLLAALILLFVVGGIMERERRQERAEQQHTETLQRQAADRAALERERAARAERLERENPQRIAEQQARASEFRRETEMRWLQQSIEPLQAKVQQFNDAMQLAAATPRVALAGQVARMQAIASETEATTIGHACMAAPKQKLVAGMREVVQGFLAFMRDENKEPYVARAQRLLEQWNAGAQACMKAAMETR